MNVLGRRQRQAKNGFTNLCEQQRPHYKKRSAEASAAHDARIRATENRIRQGKKK